MLLAASYVLVAFAHWFPQDFRNAHPMYVLAAGTAFMVRVFVFHLGLVFTLGAAAAVRRRCWRLAAAAMPLLLATLGPTLYHYRPRVNAPLTGEALRIMTINVWHRNLDVRCTIDEIQRIDPDVLLVQEYTPHWHESLHQALATRFPHHACAVRQGPTGCAFYSRRAFVEEVDKFVLLAEPERPQIRAVVELGGRPVAIYCIHLVSPGSTDRIRTSRLEIAELLDMLRDERLPAVVAGDFNFTETTPQAAQTARAGFTDAYSLSGWGRGSTWRSVGLLRWAPGLRLDHIYLSAGLTCSKCRVGQRTGSDHRPVFAEIGFVKNHHQTIRKDDRRRSPGAGDLGGDDGWIREFQQRVHEGSTSPTSAETV